MRVLVQEMMLDFPGIVVTEAVGEHDLVERLVKEPRLVARKPRSRQLMLIEDAEPHDRASRRFFGWSDLRACARALEPRQVISSSRRSNPGQMRVACPGSLRRLRRLAMTTVGNGRAGYTDAEKIDFLMMAWTPQLPSTTCVTPKSMAT